MEIRLTCSLVWHLLRENEELSPHDKLQRMKDVTPVIMSRLALYFGLIKTTMTNQLLDTNFFVQLLEEILAFKTFVLSFSLKNFIPLLLDVMQQLWLEYQKHWKLIPKH